MYMGAHICTWGTYMYMGAHMGGQIWPSTIYRPTCDQHGLKRQMCVNVLVNGLMKNIYNDLE